MVDSYRCYINECAKPNIFSQIPMLFAFCNLRWSSDKDNGQRTSKSKIYDGLFQPSRMLFVRCVVLVVRCHVTSQSFCVLITIGRQLFYRSKDGRTDEREKKPFRKSQKYLTFFRITLINSTIFDENDFRIRYIVYE